MNQGEGKWLWTWSGEPFGYRDGDELWTSDGRHVGRFNGVEIYGLDGQYLGELLDSNRLITAKFRRGAHQEGFLPLPPRAKVRQRKRLPGYTMPRAYEDFRLPAKLP